MVVLGNDCTGECKKGANTLRLKALGEHARPYLIMLGSRCADGFIISRAPLTVKGYMKKICIVLCTFFLYVQSVLHFALWSHENICKKCVEQ